MAVRFKDYYEMMGLDRSASAEGIKSAYRALARKHHPDLNRDDPGAEARFKEINEAHEVLSDPVKRKMYDRYGNEWRSYQQAGYTGDESRSSARADDFATWFDRQDGAGRPSAGGPRTADSFAFEYGGSETGGFSDFFQTLFGNRAYRPGASPAPFRRKGQDSDATVEVSFDEAVAGGTRTFEIQGNGACATCGGTGLARDVTCPTCDGTGQVTRARAIEVKIPAGVQTGSRIRIAGQGAPGQGGGPAGDVYLVVTVRPDARFEREGDNLRTAIEVPYFTAMLGGEAVVPTPTGRVALSIPPGSQPGRSFRLRGQGMPRLGGSGERGDLYARLVVTIPETLSDEERSHVDALRELAADPAG
ncbi:MAG: J domain-containing protein [Thermomicrobiales bacterium]